MPVSGWDRTCKPECGNFCLPKITAKRGLRGGNNHHIKWRRPAETQAPSVTRQCLTNCLLQHHACLGSSHLPPCLPSCLCLPRQVLRRCSYLSNQNSEAVKCPSPLHFSFEERFLHGSIGWSVLGDGGAETSLASSRSVWASWIKSSWGNQGIFFWPGNFSLLFGIKTAVLHLGHPSLRHAEGEKITTKKKNKIKTCSTWFIFQLTGKFSRFKK